MAHQVRKDETCEIYCILVLAHRLMNLDRFILLTLTSWAMFLSACYLVIEHQPNDRTLKAPGTTEFY